MALQSHLDGFNTTTGPLARSGFGFSPKAWFNWTSGRSTTTNAIGAANVMSSLGIGISASSRASIGATMANAQGTSREDSGMRDDADIFTITSAVSGAIDGLLDITSVDSDGITRVADDAPANNARINSLSWGGSDLEQVALVSFNMNTATGDQDITSVGFDISSGGCIILISAGSVNDPPTIVASSCFILGVIVVNPLGEIQQFCLTNRGIDNLATPSSQGYLRTDECFSVTQTTAGTGVVVRASCTAILSNGFRINIAETDANSRRVRALVLKGGQWMAGTLTMPGNTTAFSVSGLPFQPQGGLVATRFRAQEASDTATVNVSWGIGAFNFQGGSIVQQAQCASNNNGSDPSVAVSGVRTDRCYIRPDEAAGTLAALGQVTALNGDGFTFQTDDADPDAVAVAPFVVWGDTHPSPHVGAPIRRAA